MAFIETLVEGAGLAIAKAVLKLWWRDARLCLDTTSSLADLLAVRIPDYMDRRRARRLFEDMGASVAEAVAPLFKRAELGEVNHTAVAAAITQAIENAQITPSALAQSDLDPSKIQAAFTLSRDQPTRGFSEIEIHLWERVLAECAKLMVDISSQIPRFTEGMFRELLRRERSILEVSERVIKEVQHIRKAVDPSMRQNEEVALFEEDYRRAVIRVHDRLEIFGADLSGPSRRHRLSIAYVSLSVTARAPTSRGRLTDARSERVPEATAARLTVEHALSQARSWALRGVPGSGKTTLLKWIAVSVASGSLPSALEEWRNSVPFFVRLRECARSGLPVVSDLPLVSVPVVGRSVPAGWSEEVLRTGRGLVLVDGLDEVPAAERRHVEEWLAVLMTSFPQSRFIVTSRHHAMSAGWLRELGFADANFEPMAAPEITAFVEHWHNAVREEMDTIEEQLGLQSLQRHMLSLLEDLRGLKLLATNPLLCALLCALHRDRHHRLPSDRIELYESCVWMLVERRDVERNVDLSDYPSLGSRQRLALLGQLAYWMARNNVSQVSIPQCCDILDRNLKAMGLGGAEYDPPKVCRLFLHRTGLIREPVAGNVDFAHRTFQEFLAAKAAVHEEDLGLLVANAHSDQWREIVTLASGLGSAKFRDELILGLIERGNKERSSRHQLHLLAVSCLETCVQVAPSVRATVKKHLSSLVPPTNFLEAKAIASAGELAVPYLHFRPKASPDILRACIRALGYIGGKAALAALATYRSPLPTLLEELVRASDVFSPEEFVDNVFPDLVKMHLENVAIPPFIRAMPTLMELSIGRSPDRHLGCLSGLASLRRLDLWQLDSLWDLSSLSSLTRLESLRISHAHALSDLRSLTDVRSLRDLELNNLILLGNIGPLASLSELKVVKLVSLPNLLGLSPLAQLEHLQELTVTEVGHLADLRDLTGLSCLQSLRLSRLFGLRELKGIAGLKSLRAVELDHLPSLNDLRPLLKLPKLRSIRISGLHEGLHIPVELRTLLARSLSDF